MNTLKSIVCSTTIRAPLRRGFTRGLLAGLIALALPAWAAPAQLRNLDKQGLALQGYDPVAFFSGGKPVKGAPVHQLGGRRHLPVRVGGEQSLL